MLNRGFSLVELMITLAVLGIVMMIALPNMGDWIRNTRIRNTTESIYNGLQFARAEALRRNASVRFSLVNDMTNTCSVQFGAITSPSWVISLDDPTANCDVDPSETTAPRIIQKYDATQMGGIKWNILTVTMTGPLVFNGLGRVNPPLPSSGPSPGVAQIRVEPYPLPTENTCTYTNETYGRSRCLRVMVTNGGGVRMCDPYVTDATDPRKC